MSASGPTVALGLIKQALDESADNDLAGQLDLERDLQIEAAGTPDHAEACAPFSKSVRRSSPAAAIDGIGRALPKKAEIAGPGMRPAFRQDWNSRDNSKAERCSRPHASPAILHNSLWDSRQGLRSTSY